MSKGGNEKEWRGIALDYAREYGELRVFEEVRDETDLAEGKPVMRSHPAYRARAPFRLCYQALKEAGYGEGSAEEARRMADHAYAVARGAIGVQLRWHLEGGT